MSLPRAAAHTRRTLRAVVTAVLFAAAGALLFVAGAFIHSLGTIAISHWGAVAQVSALFAVFGAIFGTIMAFDRSADAPPLPWRFMRRFESPTLRTLLCAALGFVAVLVIQALVATPLPSAWLAIGAGCGAVLGWFGWRWARYVEF